MNFRGSLKLSFYPVLIVSAALPPLISVFVLDVKINT